MKDCTCDTDYTKCPYVVGWYPSPMMAIGKALAAAGYASTGFFREKPTEEEYRALEEYEAKHGMHYVVQTYFHAWCDAGRPDSRKLSTCEHSGCLYHETGFHKVQRAYGAHLEELCEADTEYPENEKSCDGTCEPMCDWCNRQADIAAQYRE